MVKTVYLISLLAGLIMLKKRASIVAAILFFVSAACLMPWLYALKRYHIWTWNRVYKTEIFDIGLIWYLTIGAICLVLGFGILFRTKDKDVEFNNLVEKFKAETDVEKKR